MYYSERIKGKIIPTNMLALIDEVVTLRCWHSKEVEWLFEGSKVLPSNIRFLMSKDGLEHKLIIYKVKSTNFGAYQCLGKDAYTSVHFITEALVKSAGKLKFHIILCGGLNSLTSAMG